MSESKKTQKRLVFDRETEKNMMVKQTLEEIPANEELVKKVKYHIERAGALIPKPLGSQMIGFVVGFIYERSSQDKFDFQSACLVDLEQVNITASDLVLKDLTHKIKRAYGVEAEAVRQDTPVSNQE